MSTTGKRLIFYVFLCFLETWRNSGLLIKHFMPQTCSQNFNQINVLRHVEYLNEMKHITIGTDFFVIKRLPKVIIICWKDFSWEYDSAPAASVIWRHRVIPASGTCAQIHCSNEHNKKSFIEQKNQFFRAFCVKNYANLQMLLLLKQIAVTCIYLRVSFKEIKCLFLF